MYKNYVYLYLNTWHIQVSTMYFTVLHNYTKFEKDPLTYFQVVIWNPLINRQMDTPFIENCLHHIIPCTSTLCVFGYRAFFQIMCWQVYKFFVSLIVLIFCTNAIKKIYVWLQLHFKQKIWLVHVHVGRHFFSNTSPLLQLNHKTYCPSPCGTVPIHVLHVYHKSLRNI